jgi:outer membrane biosynthesis protein TonB
METWNDESEDRSLIHRYKTAIGVVVGLAALAAIAAFAVQIFGNHSAPAKVRQISMIRILPPPPPQTPPPAPPRVEPQPTVQPMVEQKQMIEPETKPDKPQKRDEAPAKSHEKAPGPLGLNAKGEGAGDAFGLVGKPGGTGLLGDGGGGGGTRWGWYASEVQATIEEALRNNPHTRDAALRVQIKIWPDKTGRVTRVEMDSSTGDLVVDGAIKNEVLTGLQLQEPPPADLPLPIILRLTARRPD